MMKKPTQEESMAVTKVFWDINMCPVPDGYDPRLVLPCLKRFLEKNGYLGPLTATAFGKLADVPIAMLREVYSSGINLILVPFGTLDIMCLIDITERNPPPVNFMVISDPKTCPDLTWLLQSYSYNPIQPFPYHSIETLLMEGAIATETAECVTWDCLVCARDPPGRSFDTFVTHLSSEEHGQLLLSRQLRRPPKPPAVTPMVHSEQGNVTQCGYGMVDSWEIVKSAGKTFVVWDINSCPVPLGFDASMVGPCIKRFLKKEGFSGPLSIIAIGVLTDVPNDILCKVFSSGINLHNVPYGPSDIENLIVDFSTGPRVNIMVISNAEIFACMPDYIQWRVNLLKPFPNGSLLQSFLLSDLGCLKEDHCSEYSFWCCSLCNNSKPMYLISFHQGSQILSSHLSYERFITHLYGSIHQQKMLELCPLNEKLQRMSEPFAPSVHPEKNLKAVTSVIWDIKFCPVPDGCDPRRVGPCIKQFLKNKGYSGPLTITAIGTLSDIPNDILEGVYSSGITLYNIYDDICLNTSVCEFTDENPPPANIMVISDQDFFASEDASMLESDGYNVLQPVPWDSCFFLTDLGALDEEDDKCSDETSESVFWICDICDDLWGQGFENFTTHVASRPHQRELLDFLPGYDRFTRSE